MKLSTYLMFDGNCREAFTHYEKVLGGKMLAMMDHKGTPAEEHVSPEWRDKILHACLEIDGQMLMASDAPPDRSDGPMRSVLHGAHSRWVLSKRRSGAAGAGREAAQEGEGR